MLLQPQEMSIFSFHNHILLGSISTTSLEKYTMFFVETRSSTLNDFFGIVRLWCQIDAVAELEGYVGGPWTTLECF